MRKSMSRGVAICDKCSAIIAYVYVDGLPKQCPKCGDITVYKQPEEQKTGDTNSEKTEG